MRGVTLNGNHSYRDHALIMERVEIGPAVPNLYFIDIPFGKRQDITEALYGHVTYSYRPISITFGTLKSHDDWPEFLMKIYNLYNGQKIKLIFDDDPDYYYLGRAEFYDLERECRIGKFTISFECEPYKYKKQSTEVKRTLSSGENKIILKNGRMPTTFLITCDNEITIRFGETEIAHSAGSFTVPDFLLEYGDNELTVKGSGSATFSYQEGDL